jgi:hypothetical protein
VERHPRDQHPAFAKHCRGSRRPPSKEGHMSARMTARRAQAIIDDATLVKAPDWSESRRWHVTANGQVLVIIEPSYSGITRNGWTWWLADIGRMRATPRMATTSHNLTATASTRPRVVCPARHSARPPGTTRSKENTMTALPTAFTEYDWLELVAFGQKVDREGFDYAFDNYPPRFRDPEMQDVAIDADQRRAL